MILSLRQTTQTFPQRWVPLFILGAFVLTSCCTFKEYRPFPDGCYQDGSNPKHRGVQLSFIEYDDQGFPWDLNQRLSAIAHISATKNLLLVVFIHGWHNDASNYPHKDVETFTTLLNKIGQAAPVRNKYNVYGVFLAWRGERIRGPNETFNQILTPVRSLTFYSCKATASTIADRGFLRDDIYRLTDAARSRTSDSAKPVTIVIGHSFGGLILEEAIANDMAHPRLGGPKRMADLVLMLNPASDSMITAITERAFQESPPPAAQPPLPDGEPRPTMISITSQTDNATGLAFNVGTLDFQSFQTNATGACRQLSCGRKVSLNAHSRTQRLPYDSRGSTTWVDRFARRKSVRAQSLHPGGDKIRNGRNQREMERLGHPARETGSTKSILDRTSPKGNHRGSRRHIQPERA